jgi:hypothetical protein
MTQAQEHTRPPSSSTPRPTPVPTPATIATAPGWELFNSDKGRFSVMMPGIPTDKVEVTQSEHGPYTTHLFVIRGAKSVFLLGWVDYDPTFNFDPTGELDLNRENFIKGVKATLIENPRVTLAGYQAIEFTAQTADTIYKSRVYMVGRRPYQLVTGTPRNVDDTVNVNRFFDSFRVRVR